MDIRLTHATDMREFAEYPARIRNVCICGGVDDEVGGAS